MPWTNKHGIPETLAKAIIKWNSRYDYNPDPLHYSCTELTKPTRMCVLKRRFHDQIVYDVGDAIYQMEGTIVHYILEEVEIEDPVVFKERRLKMGIGGNNISGQLDLYETPGIITDWKFTTKFNATKKHNPEFDGQINVNSHLLRHLDYPAKGGYIYAIIRDWKKGMIAHDPTYPKIAFRMIPIDIWPPDKAELYINRKIERAEAYKDAQVKDMPLCSSEERWVRDENWGAIKVGNIRATQTFKIPGEAEEWAAGKKDKYDIEYRPGTDVRCRDWCPVKDYCNYYHDHVKTKKEK